ncbi:MAG TPA: hypothetical protein VK864_15685, partial [Longimicrobiales bacterium]|nr:hypothetical protein [Longimicrobiales bacterium]
MSVLSYPAMQGEATLTKDFTARQRILIGGLGALTPIVLNALIVDLPKIFQAMSLAVFVGWSLRVLVLFYLGGLFSWLHKKEREPVRIF